MSLSWLGPRYAVGACRGEQQDVPFPGVYMDREALSRRYSDGHHQVGWG